MLPAANALILNRLMWNIGSAIFVSKMPNTTSSAAPPTSPPIISGLVHPVGCPP